MTSLLKKIIAIGYDIFMKDWSSRVTLPGNAEEPTGGAIDVSLLQEFVKMMDNPEDVFTHGGKTYTLDKEYASRVMHVYVSDANEVYILHSPTDPSYLEDLVSDVGLALNFRTSRIKDNVFNQIAAENKYLKQGIDDITTIGYSLGAQTAEAAGQAGSQSKEVFLISRPITFLNFRYALPAGTFSIKSVLDPVGLLSLFVADRSIEGETKLKPEIKSVKDFIREHLAGRILSRLESLGITKVGSIVESKEAEGYAADDESPPIGGMLGKKLIEHGKRKPRKSAVKPEKDAYEKMTVVMLRSEIGVLKKALAIPRGDYVVTGRPKPELIQMLKDLQSINADTHE